MATDTTGNPILLDAAAEADGFTGRFYVSHITMTTGATGGDFIVIDGSGGNSLIGGTQVLGINDFRTYRVGHYVDGVLVDTSGVPSGGQIAVHHGDI